MTVSLIFLGMISAISQSESTIDKKPKIELKSSMDIHLQAPQTKYISIVQPKVFSVQKLPLFCKIEHKLAKSSKVNVMMRLGSLDYVNKLEGKGH